MRTGQDWIDSLPGELTGQQHLLRRLLAHSESTSTISSLSVGCSLGRGAADALSDVDAAIGVRAPRGPAGAELVSSVEQALVDELEGWGPFVDVLRQETVRGEFFLRTVFAQYADRLQLDLAVVAEAEIRRGDAAPDFVAIYRTGPDPVAADHPSALEATPTQLREWVFLGWRALLDADKYLRRRSLWEVHQRLDEARDHSWRLWAAGHGALYPWHGLSQVLDHDPGLLPARMADTVAVLDEDALRHAVRAVVDVLDEATLSAESRTGTSLHTPMAGYARARLVDDAAGTS